MKLHVLSDLHLSQGPFAVPERGADVLVLAGDIARPQVAAAWAAQWDLPVVYVPGNHEFYGGSIDATVDALRRACAGTRVRVLERDAAVIAGVRFLGATLWSDFRLYEGERRAAAIAESMRLIRDFSAIRLASASAAPFTPDDSAALFDRDAAWLACALAVPHDGPTVVVTHHAPCRRSIHPRFAGSLLNGAFVSDAEHLLDGGRVRLWVHGHMHDSFDYAVNGTRVLCNPRGYARNGVNENPRFDPGLTVEVQ
jgi:hypothetical protein